MKLTERELRKLVREELLREGFTDHNFRLLDSVRSKLGQLQKEVSDQGFEGEFRRGEVKKLERKFGKIRDLLDEIEKVLALRKR